jgi:hypothetical protein
MKNQCIFEVAEGLGENVLPVEIVSGKASAAVDALVKFWHFALSI